MNDRGYGLTQNWDMENCATIWKILQLYNRYIEYLLFNIKVIKELDKYCKLEDGTVDKSKGTEMLEVLALQIQMYTAQKNNKKLKVNQHRSFANKNRNYMINHCLSSLQFPTQGFLE